MRRIVNFRAPLFMAIGLILGIFSFYEFLFGDIWFGIVALALIFVIGVVLFILKSRAWRGTVAVIIAVLLGFGASQLNYNIINSNEVIARDTLVTGRVCDIGRNGESNAVYYLEDCIDENGEKLSGRIRTYIYGGDYQAGDILTIRGVLNSTYPIKASLQTYYLRQNVRYELDTELVVSRQDGAMKLDEIVRKYLLDVSVQYSPANGDVLYALMTGDRNVLSTEKENYFKSAGIIHLLAVSGLHVGFVVVVLAFILKRFRLHPLIEGGIMLVPLIFYAYICSFTPSVIRAIVMVACTYVTRALFSKYDLLSSLSWAVMVILLISPFNLFDVGFQLSVLSVYGIATVRPPVYRWVSKRKLPKILKYIVNSLTVSLSCSIATFFTLQLNYGYAPVLGIILNLIVIPLITVVFVISWVGMLPWLFHYVLFLTDWALEAVVHMAQWAANLSFATVSVSAIAVTTVVTALWLFVIGGYLNLRKKGKVVVNSVLAVLVALCIGLSFVKIPPQIQAYIAYGYNDVVCVMTSQNGDAAIVGNFGDAYAFNQALKYLSQYKINNCVMYITDISSSNSLIVEDALNRLPISNAYKLDFGDNYEIEQKFNEYDVTLSQQMENTSQGDYVVITSVYDGELRAVVMRAGNLAVTSVYGDDYAVSNYLNLGVGSDVYVLPNANETYSNSNLTTLSFYQSHLPLNYGANKYGTFTITQKGVTITIKFR